MFAQAFTLCPRECVRVGGAFLKLYFLCVCVCARGRKGVGARPRPDS